jgi:peroxiredoxin
VQVGSGGVPSASDAVDIAKVNKIAAMNRRATFFILVFPSIKSEVCYLLGKHYVRFTKTEHMFEKRAISFSQSRCVEGHAIAGFVSPDVPKQINVG